MSSKTFQRENSTCDANNNKNMECDDNENKSPAEDVGDNDSTICRRNTWSKDPHITVKNILKSTSLHRSSERRSVNIRNHASLKDQSLIQKPFLRKTKSAQTSSELQQKLKETAINNKFLSTTELSIKESPSSMFFPHYGMDDNENNKSCHSNNNTSKRQLRRITNSFMRRTPRQHRTTSAELIKELLYPADTPLNIRLFGGRKAVEMEIERSRKSGYIIHPCSKLRQYWDLLIMTMLIINMFVLPLDIAFFESNTLVGFHVMSDTLCLLDIILNFRTGYRCSRERQEFELDHKKIAINYLKTWFTLDLISSLPLHYIILAVSGQNLTLGLKGASRALKILKVGKLLNLLKLLRLSRIIRGISRYEEVYCLTTGLMRYIKLISMMLVVAHWNGCLHFLVPMLQDFPESCWVKLCKIMNEPWYIQYGWALFKTLSHMLCIGYGKIIPQLLSEALVTIFSMVTGATFYALFIAHSMAYIIQKDSSKCSYQEKIKQIEEYLQYRNVPASTKKRISNYFEHKYYHGRFFNEKEILSVMGRPLRNEIVYHTCRDIVEAVPFLKTGPKNFVDELLSELKFEVYMSGDHVITEGNYGTEMFFVRKGSLDILLRKRLIGQISDGGYFGEICMLTDDTRHLVTVKARSTCDVFSLSYRHLNFMLGEYPEMRSVMEQMALSKLIELHHKVETAFTESNAIHEGDQSSTITTTNTATTGITTTNTKRKNRPMKRQSSINQMKETLSGCVETLAIKIRKFKHDNASLYLEKLSDEENIEEDCSYYDVTFQDDITFQDGEPVANKENITTAC